MTTYRVHNDFLGDAIPVSDSDIDTIAEEIGVPPAALRAVITVEAAGKGFDKINRPKALFERHHFFKHLSQKKPELLQGAVDAELAYPKWGMKPYPKGSDAVYDEIVLACAIDETCALLSTSWGMGQIMGSNYKMVGCDSVQGMVEEARSGEAGQLRQMAAFIKSAGLADELSNLNWAAFARGYNGPGYAQNKYDEKLEEAYNKFA
jgi:hypothetical protein